MPVGICAFGERVGSRDRHASSKPRWQPRPPGYRDFGYVDRALLFQTTPANGFENRTPSTT
jgi:hypothetical protein